MLRKFVVVFALFSIVACADKNPLHSHQESTDFSDPAEPVQTQKDSRDYGNLSEVALDPKSFVKDDMAVPSEAATGAPAVNQAPTQPAAPADGVPPVENPVSDQAYGTPDKGSLKNAASLMDLINSYEVGKSPVQLTVAAKQEKFYYGTDELISILNDLGNFFVTNIYRNRSLLITQTSRKTGGKLPASVSHQNGVDVDVRYIPLNPAQDYRIDLDRVSPEDAPKKLDIRAQFDLFLQAIKTKMVNVFFVHPLMKEGLCKYAQLNGDLDGHPNPDVISMLSHVFILKSHNTHFHMRIKCDPHNQPHCVKNYEQFLKDKQGHMISGCWFASNN